jgi:hypothetical protein
MKHCRELLEKALKRLELDAKYINELRTSAGLNECDLSSVLRSRIREELENPESAPVAYIEYRTRLDGEEFKYLRWDKDARFMGNFEKSSLRFISLYTSPPQQNPLSDDEILSIYDDCRDKMVSIDVARAIEKAHGIG